MNRVYLYLSYCVCFASLVSVILDILCGDWLQVPVHIGFVIFGLANAIIEKDKIYQEKISDSAKKRY